MSQEAMSFRDWLLDELRRRKWNRAELARRTGILPSVITRWINNGWLPDATSCYKLSNALGVDFNFVLRMAGHDPIEPPVATSEHERLMGMVKRLDLTDPSRVSTLDGILRMWLEADDEKKRRDDAADERRTHVTEGAGTSGSSRRHQLM